MKKIIRTTLTAITVGGLLLSISACGSGDKKPDATQSAPAENTEGKSASYSSSFKAPEKVPAKWDGGAGWSEDNVGKIVALPKAVAYSALTVDKDTGFLNSNFFVYDVDGKIISKSEDAKELDPKVQRIAGRIITTTVQGRTFIVYAQQGTSKPEPTSAKVAGPLTIITVFDEDGKQVSRKTVDLKVNGPDYGVESTLGAVTVSLDPATGDRLLIDPTDGSMTKPPTSTQPGDKWAGRVDGVDLFFAPGSDPARPGVGTLTNGTWKIPVDTSAQPFANVAVNGPYISIGKVPVDPNSTLGGECSVIDVHSGKTAPGAEGLKGACPVPASATPDAPINLTGGFVAENRIGVASSADPGVPAFYDPTLAKAYVVPSNISFNPVASSADGIFYGTTASSSGEKKVAAFDLSKDSEPKVLVDVKRVPTAISGNGIAVFSGDDVSKVNQKAFFMTPKK